MAIWRHRGDNLKNGAVIGGLLGLAIWQGSHVYTFLLENIPTAWLKFGELSLPIYLIIGGALIGYALDRK